MIAPEITALRLQLRKAGFHPLPLEGKVPHIEKWQQKFLTISDEEIRLWPKMWHLAANTGVLAKFAPGLDIDIMIEAAAEAVELLARTYFEERGDIHVRFGKPPKRLIPLRTDEPFEKLFYVFKAPDGSEHKIEMLGDGQQYVVDGIHPDTRLPYGWFGGNLATIKREDLPDTRLDDAKQFINAARKLLEEDFGFVVTSASSNLQWTNGGGGPHDPGKDPHADPELIAAALAAIPNNADWERWYTIGMAVWRATDGSAEGFAVWDTWSKKSPKYNAHNTAQKWAAFFRSPPTKIGAGTIFHLADQASPNWRNKEQPDTEAEIERLAKLSDVEYDREREAAAKKLGIRLGTLDQRVAAKKRAKQPTTDGGLEDNVALEFSAKYATDARYVHKWGTWLFWTGVRWKPEETLIAFHLARELCRAAEDASHKTVAAVTGLARTDRRQAAVTSQWDADPWLLGTPKGTIDLRTGKLLPPKAMDYITKITAVAPSDDPPRDSCPMFLIFLNRVMKGDEELQDYLQRVCGYSLTGDTTEDALFFHYGKGGNGKSVFLDTVSGILADYHEAADMELFVVTHGERHPTDLASLRGARMVTAVETEEGKRWAEAKLKQMTGGDPIKARFMRQDFFTYIPQFKLQFAGNHKPAIRNVDMAISRRMNLIPWLVTIPKEERDKDLSNKLKAEWPGILRWMIDGCLAWQRVGLKPPDTVTGATRDYLDSQDTAQNFFDDCCVFAKNECDTFEHIWDGYVDWAEDCREFVGTKKAFGQKLKDKGFEMIQRGPDRAYTYIGIRCIRENKKKLMEEARLQRTSAGSAFRPVVVSKAPKGVECVQCQTIGDHPVLKIRDGRVPDGQPGGRAECLHWLCAPKWFAGQFHNEDTPY